MLYVSFLVFIFLANVNKVSSPRDAKHCEWFCTNTAKTPLTGHKMEVRLASPLRDYQDGFSFMQFTTTTALEHTFQPLLNQAEMGVSNGIDALNSHRFNISFDNRSCNKPSVGYVHLETNYHISAGFSNVNVLEDYELTLASFWHLLIRLFIIWYIISFADVLTSFCNTRKKIEMGTGREAKEHEDGPIQDQGEDFELRIT